MFADGCDDWLGKLIKVTLVSVENDSTLDFEPTDSFVHNRNMPLKQRMLQLKIRIKSIIDAITTTELPNHFVELLVAMIDDGNYFSKNSYSIMKKSFWTLTRWEEQEICSFCLA